MLKLSKLLRRFAATSGATLVEYAVALLIVIIVGAGSISALGSVVSDTLSDTADAF